MILRKPYAFFIKAFRPMHLIMSLLTCYLIFITNKILVFFNSYIYSNTNVVGTPITEELVKNEIFIIPILLIIFSLIFLGIMFKKDKPIVFYVVNTFLLLGVLVISIYTTKFLGLMEDEIQTIKLVKLSHDLILINMVIEVVLFILLLIRGLGLNFKKFNFESDITKLSVNEEDKEEFELNINVDLDTTKRNRKRTLRHLKYIYKENKFMVFIFSMIVILVVFGIFSFIYFYKSDVKKEGNIYAIKNFNILVNKTLFVNESFSGEKITDDYLVVTEISLQSNQKDLSLFLKDFSLEVGDVNFPANRKYLSKLADIGILYDGYVLRSEFSKYILVFEIPIKYSESDLYLVYNNEGSKVKIKLNPQRNLGENKVISSKTSETLNFKESLGDISFNVNSFDIKSKFLIKYNYCFSKEECIVSKEYITPSLDQNFDKVIIKLNVDYENKQKEYEMNNFFKFFTAFGAIKYKLGDTWYTQISGFEELKSKKVDNKNNIYIGVNSKILDAESIKLVFNVRNLNYEYILK